MNHYASNQNHNHTALIAAAAIAIEQFSRMGEITGADFGADPSLCGESSGWLLRIHLSGRNGGLTGIEPGSAGCVIEGLPVAVIEADYLLQTVPPLDTSPVANRSAMIRAVTEAFCALGRGSQAGRPRDRLGGRAMAAAGNRGLLQADLDGFGVYFASLRGNWTSRYALQGYRLSQSHVGALGSGVERAAPGEGVWCGTEPFSPLGIQTALGVKRVSNRATAIASWTLTEAQPRTMPLPPLRSQPRPMRARKAASA